MKKILIRLQSSNELICYEAVSLAMTLATFDYHVQLLLEIDSFSLLLNANNRICGMLKSLSLYDMPPAWLANHDKSEWLIKNIEPDLAEQFVIITDKIDLAEFDSVLSF
ncbi:MAG: hypothetical protein KGV51_02215 [Moraxellaceae bacterium]|nr:hypothetical protein [Moraxellaceae bacterium]